jgi:outer membrane protein assembly factor BamD
MSNFRQFRSIDLPQQNVGEAVDYFARLIDTYPESEYLEQAKVALQKCRRFMAEHEIFVADFYWRTERYRSAYERYLFVVDNFQDLPEVVEYASERAKMSYIRYRKASSEEERIEREGSWKQWFDWL